MKYVLLLAIAVLLVTLFVVSGGTAVANGGPHGDYTATTDKCAGCHRAHTATGPKLLIAATTWDLCMTCHGSGASGAMTDVADGDWEGGSPGPLNGGGFANYGGSAVTSIHNADNSTAAAWGNGGTRGVATNISANLTCASCHDPHGNTNYRILRTTVNGVTPVTVPQVDEVTKSYTSEVWGAGMSGFCAACHGAYHVISAGSGSDAIEALNGGYTHRIDMQWDAAYAGAANPESTGMGGYKLPLAQTDNPGAGDGVVVCNTCHLSHGSSAAMSGYADGAGLPGATKGGLTPDSALLRLENRGVCEVCHQK